MITFSRKQTPLKILDDGLHVGNIKSADYGYMLEINECYFLYDKRILLNSPCGSMLLAFKKLGDAKIRAEEILSVIKVEPYRDRK